MASSKKDKPAPTPSQKANPKAKVKVLSKQACKDVRGGLSSSVMGGLAGPEEFNFQP